MGLEVWCEDEAGPYSTQPYHSHSWQPITKPLRFPHEYLRNGTAKMLTLFRPKNGTVIAKGVTSTTNKILHSWLKAELASILLKLPEIATEATEVSEANYEQWAVWQEGLKIKITLPKELPPLRVLLIMDNLAGHKTAEFVLWLFANGIMPLYTPLRLSILVF